MEKVIAFDVWGDYAHFKKFHTTASPLTFSMPPPTAVAGMIGAILGMKPGEYQKLVNEYMRLAIGIRSKIRKTRMGINWIDTKKAKMLNRISGRTQIMVEYLREPRFRIYALVSRSDLHYRLREMLVEHKSHYTIYLGISECIAGFTYVGEFDVVSTGSGFSEVNSSIPIGILTEDFGSVKFESDRRYARERMPVRMRSDRVVELYEDIVIETEGRSINCSIREYKELSNGERVVFF